jgi:homoserine dehydrogenase
LAGARAKPVRIALLGCGTVGTGVVKLLRQNADALKRRLGAPLELVGVADRSLQPDRSIGLTSSLITRDSAALVSRPDVDIVVELFGGIEPARTLILQALAAGKDVVTVTRRCSPSTARIFFALPPKREWRLDSRPASAAAYLL